MAEHNSVLKQLKDGKLSEKPCAGEKSDIWQDFVYSFNSDDCTSIHWATNFWSCFFILIFWCFLMFFGALSPKMTLVFS